MDKDKLSIKLKMSKKRLIQIIWRKWPCSPLLVAGRLTMHFTKSIAFGYDNAVSLTVYFGWLIIQVDNYYGRSIAELCHRNFRHIWIVKYGK